MRSKKRKRRGSQKKIIIVSEGEVTEPTYFNGVRIYRRIQKERLVIYAGAGVPRSVVEKAIEVKEQNEEQNRRDKIAVVDEVWAVFDRDEHPEVPTAKKLAKNNGIKIAFSNPCIELFLLLHFQVLNRDEHRDEVARLLRKHVPGYDKSFDYSKSKFQEKYATAKENCNKINSRSRIVDGIETSPYCSVVKLIDALNQF